MAGSASAQEDIKKQIVFLNFLLSSGNLYSRVQNIFNPENFDRTLRSAAQFFSMHVNQYGAIPTLSQINLQSNVQFELYDNIQPPHEDWFLEEFETFTRRNELERAIFKSADLLNKGEFDPVEKIIRDAVQIGLTKDLGIDYFKDPKERLLRLKNSNGQVSTGWKEIDGKLYGGMNRGELNVFCGSSGCVTGDTPVKIIEKIKRYGSESSEKLNDLWERTQPQEFPISYIYEHKNTRQFLVSSPDGWVPVIDVVIKDKFIIYSIQFESGKIIECSHDHLFQTVNGKWKFAGECLYGDILIGEECPEKITNIFILESKTPVYDLSIDHPNHRYFTNGVCSHNTGKSLFLQNIALNWMEKGLNGIYLTLELSEELVAMRLDSMITGIGSKEIFRNIDNVEMKIAIAGKNSGRLKIKYMSSQSTVNQIKSYVKELSIQSGFIPDFICIDYLDLVMPSGAKVDVSDVFTKDKLVCEELRSFAMELKFLLATASQLNRNSFDEIEFTPASISGGLSKLNTADNLFGIYTSRSMKERGAIQLQFMKTRNSSGVGSKVDLDFNNQSLRISDSSQPEDNAGIMTGSSLLAQIKSSSRKRENFSIEDDDSNSITENKKDVLKNFLSNLNKK